MLYKEGIVINMKNALKISVLFILIIVAVLFSGCYPPSFLYGGKYSFFEQPNCEWVSEEYGVRVISHERGEQADLIIQSNGKEYIFNLDSRGGSTVYGLGENMITIEKWRTHYYRTKACITVRHSEFFEEDEMFTLYLVED